MNDHKTSLAEKRAPRILLVISNLEYGGAQRQVVELANAIDPDQFEIHVCSLSTHVPLAADLRDREKKFHIVVRRRKFDVGVVLCLVRLVRRLRPVIVHGFLFDADVAVRLVGKLAGTPVVLGSERNSHYRIKRLHQLAFRLTRGCVDAVIANSNAGAAFNASWTGQNPARFRVVHNGVDVKRFQPGDAKASRAAAGLSINGRYVGIFASFKPQKNHSMFFEAVARVASQVGDLHALVVGDALYGGRHGTQAVRDEALATVDRLGIRERCVFVPNRRDVAPLYRACDVTVLPSWYEGTPNVVLESMACGVPTIATNVGDNAHFVLDGETGFLVNRGDATGLAARLELLLMDTRLRARMGHAARERAVQEFSSGELAKKMTRVYQELLVGTGRATRRRSLAQLEPDGMLWCGARPVRQRAK